ncbi:helix-turn-helix transcriptional regulator [Rhizorhapis sp.]|uniref:helix-turn-helix transcriptional regulator n=1 Tax=Rhizorhapis sp. TaxID=1968842 RepID=UPI002B465D8A|nr:helix-turn-helix transcriptional regulator [Rhizorhapis sp.]HKR17187.1 helix-turn-helix transcriptional regulator [Rhizorhapis sp.]
MLNCAEKLREAALAWLDSGTTARLIVNEALEIRWANKAARRTLENHDFLEGRDGLLCLARGTGMATLQARASEVEDNDVLVHSFSEDGLMGLVIVLRLLPASSSRERLYGLELRWANEAESAQYKGYRSYFGVTQAEDRVLQQLLKGHNVEKCAANLDIAVDTVRSHIRQLYSKLNVSSREALFYAMAPFRVQ